MLDSLYINRKYVFLFFFFFFLESTTGNYRNNGKSHQYTSFIFVTVHGEKDTSHKKTSFWKWHTISSTMVSKTKAWSFWDKPLSPWTVTFCTWTRCKIVTQQEYYIKKLLPTNIKNYRKCTYYFKVFLMWLDFWFAMKVQRLWSRQLSKGRWLLYFLPNIVATSQRFSIRRKVDPCPAFPTT